MVIKKIKDYMEKRRQKKAEELVEKERLESYRGSEEMKRAEQVKKEADRLAHLKQYKHAIDEYNKALEIYPYNEKELVFKKPAEFFFKIYFNIGASNSFMNKFNFSIDYFDKALKIENISEENKVKALMSKGNCFYMAKQLLKGDYKDIYRVKIESEFNVDDKTVDLLNRMDEKEGLINLAHQCFTRATEIDRHDADSWYKKGHMEFLMDMVKDSMLSFDNVLMIHKKYENKENIELFDDIRREKGIDVKHPKVYDSDLKFKTKSGHIVKNKSDLMISNFLFDNNLIFQYNMAVSWADRDDFKPTFFIPKLDLYLEHFKYDYIKDYQKLMKANIKQYEKNRKKLIYTISEDERNIEESLKIKLKPFIVL